MKAWKSLGTVETIYEEEYEFSSSSSSSISPSPSSPPTPLHSRVEKWTLVVGRKTEVLIRVQGKCFHLHKDPLISRSTYLKRQLTEFVTELTLSPPLNISSETFTLVAAFCYGAIPVITPFNIAALRTASELLEMTESDGDDSLVQITDTYFRQVVAVNGEYASIVFRSSLSLLPEAETASFLVSRCVEALDVTDDDGGSIVDFFEDIMLTVCPEDFHIVADAMQRRFNSHDVVYKIVDLYIRGHRGKITEEQKTQISSAVDCTKLSSKTLMEAVQNPAMPLRFIIRAMLVDQLHTRRRVQDQVSGPPPPPATLGSLLQQDAAARHAHHMKASLDATALRVASLERELAGMRRLLAAHSSLRTDPSGGRSSSLRTDRTATVAKDDRLSSSLRVSSSTDASNVNAPRLSARIGRGFINGIKKAFRLHTSSSSSGFGGKGSGGNGLRDGGFNDVVAIDGVFV